MRAAAILLAASAVAFVAHAHAQAQSGPAMAASSPSSHQLATLCDGCSWVQDVHSETRQGKGSGLGVVGGAVIGGLLGNKIGGGTGKAITTVGGAGGYAGNEVEKNAKKQTVWIVQLVNRDGSARSVELGADPNLRTGDTVRERDGQLLRP